MPYVDFMHTGVGSALLVSTVMGNAKASECGTGNRYSSYAFFLHNCHIRGNCAAKEINQMKHRYLKLFFAALLCIATTGARAYDFEVDGIFYFISSSVDKTVAVTHKEQSPYSNKYAYTGHIIIPKNVTYNNTTYSVTMIGGHAFYGCTELTSIRIPNSVTRIGNYAFNGCTGLKEVHISDIAAWCNIEISDYANPLSRTTKLYLNNELITDLVIPDEITEIKHNTFSGYSSLTNVTIPNSVTSIGSDAFYGCTGLTSITIGNCVTSIGEGAFSGCTELKEVHISDIAAWCNIEFSGDANPLYYAKNLYLNSELITDLIIPDGITDIKDETFLGCSSLTSVTIGNCVASIGKGAFKDCTGLTSVTIGNNVTKIGNEAFSYCSGLTSVTIPNSVTSIGGAAFKDCTGLTSIEIPNSVTSIGSEALYNTAWYNNQPDGAIYAGNVLYKYKGTMYPNTSISIKDGTLTIEAGVFSGCTGLTSVTIPNSVTSIGGAAFLGCTGLTSIEIPNSVTSIGSGVFYGCSGLKSVKIGNGITNIEYGTFSGCSALTNIYIEDGDSILTLHGQRSGGYNTEGTGLFNSAPLKNLYIGRELEFESERNYGYSPFYSKDIDTITISKKPKRNLRFGGGSKFITILYIDNYSYNPYSEVVPQYQLSENTTVRYFKTPYSESFFDNINCIKVPLGEITSDYHSISVTLNDSLIERVRIIVKDENTGTGDRVPSGGNVSRDGTVKINGHYIDRNTDDVYCLDGLKIGTDYPVTLRYVYNGIEYTTATTISTKNISPEPTIYCNQTLSTATIKLSVGDTIGLGAPIDEIGIIYNGENLPAERDEILSNLHRITISNLRPGNEYYYNIYFKIGTEYYRGSKSFEFSTKSPSIAIIKNLNTQTTSSIKIIGSFSDEHLAPSRVGAYFYDNGYHEYSADEDNNILIEGLKPYTTYYITPFVEYEEFGRYTGETKEITTDSIGIGCAATATATTITLEGTYEVGDATLIEHGFVEGEANIGNRVIIGLDPDTEYSFTYYVTTEEGGTVQTLVTARTEQLTFNTLRAKATSNTRAVICAEANIANEEAGTGFEWRRIDAPDLVPSEIVSCAVHEGVMEGALHNLSANTYYKYRPYYTAASGKSYYGEWIGFGTADAYVYFTPTVHTYATASAGTNAARLSGYVLAGSDDIIEQGFEYWPVGKAEAAAMRGALHSNNVKRVTATGQRMSVVVEELDYGTVYKCRAYAITAKETVYGEEQSFETSFPTGIEENREESITIQTAGNSVYINGCNENETVFVYTLFGAVAYNGPEKEITLNSGTYIVKVGNITKKIQIR